MLVQGFQTRWALGVLTVAVALVFSLYMVACGESEEREQVVSMVKVVHWSVRKQVGPKALLIAAATSYCHGDPKPTIAKYRIKEVNKSMYVRVFVLLRRRYSVVCLGSLVPLKKVIRFSQPLDEAVIFDASTVPPVRKWPQAQR